MEEKSVPFRDWGKQLAWLAWEAACGSEGEILRYQTHTWAVLQWEQEDVREDVGILWWLTLQRCSPSQCLKGVAWLCVSKKCRFPLGSTLCLSFLVK